MIGESVEESFQEVRAKMTHLHVACPTIKVEMQVFYLSKLSKFVRNIVLGRLFVHICYEHYPSFHGCIPNVRCVDKVQKFQPIE